MNPHLPTYSFEKKIVEGWRRQYFGGEGLARLKGDMPSWLKSNNIKRPLRTDGRPEETVKNTVGALDPCVGEINRWEWAVRRKEKI